MLAFYQSAEFLTLREFVPEIAPIFDTHRMMVSQAVALMASASLKISRARKDALRPIFSTTSVLRHPPTAANILGDQDLASLSEKAKKENDALCRVFRTTHAQRGRYKFSRQSVRNRLSRGRFFQR